MFSVFAFWFGVLLGLGFLFHNVLYIGLCRLFKVRVLKAALMLDVGMHLLKTKVRQTEYILGWLPTGTYVSFFGVDENDLTFKSTISEHYAFIRKPLWQRYVLKGMTVIGWPLLLVITLFFVGKTQSFTASFHFLFQAVQLFFLAMFKKVPVSAFTDYLRSSAGNYHKLLLAFSFFLAMVSLLIPLQILTHVDPSEKYQKSKTSLYFVLFLAIGYLYFWKIPSFAISILSISRFVQYTADTLLGLFSCLFIGHMLFVFFAKKIKPW